MASNARAEPPASAAPSDLFPPGSVFADGHRLPRLIVFDLDYTLWPFWVDTHVAPPIRLASAGASSAGSSRQGSRAPGAAAGAAAFQPGTVVDSSGETFSFYCDVPHILQGLPAAGIRMGVASRTSEPRLAREMLALLRVPAEAAGGVRALDVFDAGLEIYPTTKLRHMQALQQRTGLPYEEFLFFDDESRNRNVETLGVTFSLVQDGVCWDAMEQGVRLWRQRHGHSGSKRSQN